MDLQEYQQAFDEAERDFEASVEAFGVPFERTESSPRARRVSVSSACGFHCENGTGSLWRGWISPACLACRTGEQTATFFVDLRCTKHCYFCFNPNQDYYEHFLSHTRDIVAELEEAHAAGAHFRCLAVTGGEPMLYKEQVCEFLHRASQLYPGVHTRLYTSGDLLDESGLLKLAQAGLTEIRFSVKPLEVDEDQERVYALIKRAVSLVPHVMIEVPVVPGSLPQMKELLCRADSMGVRGVNLLEFCFPLHNAAEFYQRGFTLRKQPFTYLYNYWYGGGIPVAQSETEALALLEFADQKNLTLGIHYCSSDNKNTGQIFQQNKPFSSGHLQSLYPWLSQDEGDRFLKCAKAFGSDAYRLREWAEGEGTVPYDFDPHIPSISLPLACIEQARAVCPGVLLTESVNVLEPRESAPFYLREVDARNVL